MTTAFHRIARIAILLALVLASSQPPISKATPADAERISGLTPEVRLRKLHLVRPDLIPYPIAYEVCC